MCGRKKAAQSRTRSQKEFEDELQMISPSIEVLGVYSKVTYRINVRCKICGKEWTPLAYSLLSGKGCPHCSAQKGAQVRGNKLERKSTERFVDELKAINPNIIVNSEYINNKTKINVECTVCGHIWDVVPASLLNGHGCPKCAKRKNGKK